MKQYRLFFSWQNDRKDTRTILNSALKKVAKKLASEDIDLFIDQDTRERVGKRNIDSEVLEKIRKCDIFLADLTPVTTFYQPEDSHSLPKHLPNSNVMYEYGYALHAKGEKRMIALASLDKAANEHIEYMPFDINHDTITLFSDANSLSGLHDCIKRIIEDVDKERAAYIPVHDCSLLVLTDKGFNDKITIHPKYKKVSYIASSHKEIEITSSQDSGSHGVPASYLKKQQASLESIRIPDYSRYSPFSKIVRNHSLVPISLVFFNKGSDALDNVKITVMADKEEVSFAESDLKQSIQLSHLRSFDESFIGDTIIFQRCQSLNPYDSISFDDIYVHAPHDIGSFYLCWSLNSRNFQTKGKLTIFVEPDYEYSSVENNAKAGTETIEDCEESE